MLPHKFKIIIYIMADFFLMLKVKANLKVTCRLSSMKNRKIIYSLYLFANFIFAHRRISKTFYFYMKQRSKGLIY